MPKITPRLMYSDLTGNMYIVTAIRPDGSARTKYNVTDQFRQFAAALSTPTPSLSLSQVEKVVRDSVKGIDWFEADADSLVQDIMARLSSTEKEATTP